MRKGAIVLALIFTLFIFTFGYDEILSFVPKDFDVAIVVDDASKNFVSLTKDVSFFKYMFSEEGLAFNLRVNNILDEAEKESQVPKEVFKDAISKEVLIASKGVVVNADDITSLDINFYIDLLRNIGANSIVVFESREPDNFLKFLSALTDLKLSKDDGYYIMQDKYTSVFAKVYKGYVVISGNKASVERAILSMDNEDEQLIETNADVMNFFERNNGFILGFFKGNSFKVSMGVDVKEELKTDRFELVAYATENRFVVDVKQYVNGNLEKPLNFLSSSDYMDALPKYGNYYMGISVKSSAEALNKIIRWFSGKSEDIDKISKVFMMLLKNSSDKAYIMGDISSASDVTFAALIKFNKEKEEELKKVLVEYGARESEDGWVMSIGKESHLFFYYEDSYMIVSNIKKEKYEKLSKVKKLIDYPPYSYIKKYLPKKDILRVFVDVGDILYKTVGIKHSSVLMFYQIYEKGVFIYKLEVM